MYLPVNTREDGNPILAILGGMPTNFFLHLGFVCIRLSECRSLDCIIVPEKFNMYY